MGKLRGTISLAKQALLRRLLPGWSPKLYYVAPGADWIIDWVGRYLARDLPRLFGLQTSITANPRWLSGQIIHYGSLWSYVGHISAEQNRRNHIVATVFHGYREAQAGPFDEALDKLLAHYGELEKLVTASTMMRDRFISWGVDAGKIATIPLGIDLSLFVPPLAGKKEAMRAQLGIPADAFCIGSFHKDGTGWEEGLEPKHIKGPDVFLKVIERLRNNYKVHVLLTAPARGYVIQGLEKMGIPYTHHVLKDYPAIVDYYHALDAYIVPSREEGGPSGVLEALACGVPLVSTRVGLAPDVVEHDVSGLLLESEDVEGLAASLASLVDSKQEAHRLAQNGLLTIRDYDWEIISKTYYLEVYGPIVETYSR